jgi:hypothetical protein
VLFRVPETLGRAVVAAERGLRPCFCLNVTRMSLSHVIPSASISRIARKGSLSHFPSPRGTDRIEHMFEGDSPRGMSWAR